MNEITWYDWIDGESEIERLQRRRNGCPRLTAPQLEVLWQMRMTVWDGYVISKATRDWLAFQGVGTMQGLVDRCNGWNFITRLGMAVLDTYGLLKDDRYGTRSVAGDKLWTLKPDQFVRLREQGWLLAH